MSNIQNLDQAKLGEFILANISKLPSKEHGFAKSIAKASQTYFPMSESQIYWLYKVCQRIEGK